jgi:hypothetical protein
MAFSPWSWTNFENGEQKLSIREKINALGTYVSDVLKNAYEHRFNNTGTLFSSDNVQDVIVEIGNTKADKAVLSLEGRSYVDQLPTGVDTPLQLSFGSAQNDITDDVMIDSNGTVTFNTAGQYRFDMNAQYGRTNANNVSLIFYRFLINDTQEKPSLCAKLDNANIVIPYFVTCTFDVSAGDTLKMEIMRDSSGDNSGGVYTFDPVLAGWENAASTCIRVYKVGSGS